MASSNNKIRRITSTAGGTKFFSAIPDGANHPTGPIIRGQHVTCYIDPTNIASVGVPPVAEGETAPSVPAFSPEDIENLTVWMDAQESSTITGDPITNWESRVGSVTWVEGVPGAQPSLVTVNGLTMINFDGGDFLSQAGGSPTTLQPGSADFTIVSAFRATDADRGMLWINDDAAGKRWLLRTHVNGVDIEFSIDDNTTAQTLTASDVDFTDDTVRVIIASRDGTNLRFYYGDGGTLTEDAASPVAIGSYGDLGAGVNPGLGDLSLGGGQGLSGDIGELFFYKQALSSAERTSLYDYLVSKWSL